ncbi:MAG TPA: hypothetical protein VN989_07790 [Casimicrobiaceae bacterium]|nr:hypothetical protein [Casimicrobiaceae bacterium]
MGATAFVSGQSFSERGTQLLERLDYRRVETADEWDAIQRLRYDAYHREGAIEPTSAKKLADAFDESHNAWIYGLYLDGRLVSSIRIHIASEAASEMPALPAFSDILVPELQAGKVIVDPSRFVVDSVAARDHPQLAYMTLRIPWLACEYFNAQLVLATVRPEHRAFYKRVFGQQPICPPRPYHSLIKPLSLMMLEYRTTRDQVNARYPFFRSTFFERRMLFERPADAPRHAASAAA